MTCLNLDIFSASLTSTVLLAIGLLAWSCIIYCIWNMWKKSTLPEKQNTPDHHANNKQAFRRLFFDNMQLFLNIALGNPLTFIFIWLFFIPLMVFLSYPVIYVMQYFACMGHHP